MTESAGWEQEIRAVEAEANRAFLDRDLERLERLFSDELLVNSPINRINDKPTLLKLLGSGVVGHVETECHIERIERFDDTVVVMGRDEVVDKEGSPRYHRRFTNLWRREHGAWRLLARHANVTSQPPGWTEPSSSR